MTTATSDLTERFAFHALDGRKLDGWHDPTGVLAYNMPPLLTDSVLSPASTHWRNCRVRTGMARRNSAPGAGSWSSPAGTELSACGSSSPTSTGN